MCAEKIRLATSIPSLKDKITVSLNPDSDEVFWYIRFNIPLDVASVSHDTMDVTDTEGYIMRTEISYDEARNMIVISPVDSYEENVFYLLNISTKVKSAKGQNLRSKIHILFKLVGKQISEFKVLKSTVTVPKPKKRPKNYDQIRATAKVYSTPASVYENTEQHQLPQAPISANIVVPAVGIVLMAANVFLRVPVLWAVALGVCVLGGVLLWRQLREGTQRSVLAYNKGVRLFNKEAYAQANVQFQKALDLDDNNEMAEYALNKVTFYL